MLHRAFISTAFNRAEAQTGPKKLQQNRATRQKFLPAVRGFYSKFHWVLLFLFYLFLLLGMTGIVQTIKPLISCTHFCALRLLVIRNSSFGRPVPWLFQWFKCVWEMTAVPLTPRDICDSNFPIYDVIIVASWSCGPGDTGGMDHMGHFQIRVNRTAAFCTNSRRIGSAPQKKKEEFLHLHAESPSPKLCSIPWKNL